MIHSLMINLEAYLMSWLGDSTISAVIARMVALVVALLIFWLLYRLINKLFLRISTVLEDTKGNRIISLKIQRQEILSAENVTLINCSQPLCQPGITHTAGTHTGKHHL